jgi:hypothetical protein
MNQCLVEPGDLFCSTWLDAPTIPVTSTDSFGGLDVTGGLSLGFRL